MLRKVLTLLLLFTAGALVLARASILPSDETEQIRTYTRPVEFNYIAWISDALLLRGSQEALGASRFMAPDAQADTVRLFIDLVGRQEDLARQVNQVYADPTITNPAAASASLRQQQADLSRQLDDLAPLAESILQLQAASVVASAGLAAGGQPIPPVWYHSTPLPLALIVSPRSRIETTADISLNAGLAIEQIVSIEDQVASNLDVSALVVPVGGIGVYPTMVMRTTDLQWLAETVAHEWIHNYLTLRPLGLSYETSPELRTMNETTASIAGGEIGAEIIRRWYPELVPPPSRAEVSPPPPEQPDTPVFSFNKEMHAVRVHVDALLAAGKIDEAEQFMEARRQVFIENGYALRKLNQAYFAFYGAYADQPGGAAGEDPVGPAVRQLRAQSASLSGFLRIISRMTSFAQLQAAVAGAQP